MNAPQTKYPLARHSTKRLLRWMCIYRELEVDSSKEAIEHNQHGLVKKASDSYALCGFYAHQRIEIRRTLRARRISVQWSDASLRYEVL